MSNRWPTPSFTAPIAPKLLMTLLGSAGCPSASPGSPPPHAHVERPPITAVAPDSTGASPSPPALVDASVRPMAGALWRALEAVDQGDPNAFAGLMTEQGRWFPPGDIKESVGVADELPRAMAPWAGPSIELDLRRIIDLEDGPLIAQLSVGHLHRPERHELVLVVDTEGDTIASIRHYGDPLGPLRFGPAASNPLDLGPIEPLTWHGPSSSPDQRPVAPALLHAIDQHDDRLAQSLLDPAVVMHDVVGRTSRHGPSDFLAAYRAELDSDGHRVLTHRYSSPPFVMVEGAIVGTQRDASGHPREYGFFDIHRELDGKVVETWHYRNRRGRRSSSSAKPLHPLRTTTIAPRAMVAPAP